MEDFFKWLDIVRESRLLYWITKPVSNEVEDALTARCLAYCLERDQFQSLQSKSQQCSHCVYINIPLGSSGKDIAKIILDTFGIQFSIKETEEGLWHKVYTFLNRYAVQMLIFNLCGHYFIDSRKTDVLLEIFPRIHERLNISIVVLGAKNLCTSLSLYAVLSMRWSEYCPQE